ncbi:BTAD domain-containing putative transcriptional regulator [Kitasatospora sp. MMS16-BH015]|uniref:AfsR/SARP family transcriptional regulator n=1 Tax=Kitasatospora sp. MMS16-BH015 TaxID=2018025 RepID=UPI001C2BD22D|nr:BTAD domain-containing putative transcriptional regulator [Kitasatospora sp. MMS16-BH015]
MLIDRIWDEENLPKDPTGNLHTLAARLRVILRKAVEAEPGLDEGSRPAVVTAGNAYELTADPETIDWQQFLRLVHQARSYADSGDDERAVETYQDADRLWRGEALTGLVTDWAESARQSMTDQRFAATLARGWATLRLGRFDDLAIELAPQLDQHPHDEELVRLLVTALYGCGRQGAALALCQATFRALRSELGTGPGEPLARLHQRLLQQSPVAELIPPPSSAAPRGAARLLGPSNLPTLSPLEGRADELARLTGLDSRPGGAVRVETICGLGGAGKSLLALHAADRLRELFPDAQLHLDLRTHKPGQTPLTQEAALARLLRALGLPAKSIPRDPEELQDRWQAELCNRRVLLVLDDAAHADQVRPLLPKSRASLTLVTSRHRLVGLPDSKTVFLDQLATEDAVALFNRLVGLDRATDPDLVLDIVERCGRLPLAITLAASHLRGRPAWELSDLLRRLSDQHGLLSEFGNDDHSVRRVFAASYRALTADQRSAFRLLSLHPGPDFGPEDAAALIGRGTAHADRMIEDLLYRSLLEEPKAERYRYHDLVASYAAELRTEEGSAAELTAATRRLARWAVVAVDLADRSAYPRLRLPVPPHYPRPESWPDEDRLRAWLNRSCDALIGLHRHAAANGLDEEADWLAHVLGEHLDHAGFWPEAEAMHRAAASHWRLAAEPQLEAHARISLSAVHTRTAHYEAAAAESRRASTLARSAGDRSGHAEALLHLGVATRQSGDLTRALHYLQKSLDTWNRLGDSVNRARTLNALGVTLLQQGDSERALVSLTYALAGIRKSRDFRREAIALNNLSDCYEHRGDLISARRAQEQAIAIGAGHVAEIELATFRVNLSSFLDLPRERNIAVQHCRHGISVFRRLNDHPKEAASLTALGDVHLRSGDAQSALSAHLHALQICLAIGFDRGRAQALFGAGQAELALGHPDRSAAHLAEGAQVAHALGARELERRLDSALQSVRPTGEHPPGGD